MEQIDCMFLLSVNPAVAYSHFLKSMYRSLLQLQHMVLQLAETGRSNYVDKVYKTFMYRYVTIYGI